MGRKKKIEAKEEVREEILVESKRVIARLTTDFNRADLNELRDRLNELVDVINSQ